MADTEAVNFGCKGQHMRLSQLYCRIFKLSGIQN